MNNGVNAENDDRNALLAFLQVLRGNQEFYMRQQWAIVNYSFLIYGAIIGLIKSVDKISCPEKIISFSISTLMCAAACFFIWRLNGSLKEAQCMVNEIYNGIPVLNKILDKCSKKPTSVSWLFTVILIFGNLAVLWVILRIQ